MDIHTITINTLNDQSGSGLDFLASTASLLEPIKTKRSITNDFDSDRKMNCPNNYSGTKHRSYPLKYEQPFIPQVFSRILFHMNKNDILESSYLFAIG